MSFSSGEEKKNIILKFARTASDVGSPEVQVALLTKRLQLLAVHFAKHKEDKHSNRGMLTLIARRKKLLTYLKRESTERYKNTIEALGLRK